MKTKKKKPIEKTTPMFLRKVPVGTKVMFKAWCIRNGKTMSEVLIHFMDDCARKEFSNDLYVRKRRKQQ